MALSVSFLVPTLNSERTLRSCLEAIRSQDYPSSLVEIIVADGGSVDQTRKIAEEYSAIIVENPKVTGEAGKAAALTAAKGDLVALIDSDNIITHNAWLLKMTAPFELANVVGSEPIRFDCDDRDSIIDRYCALAGVNDPLCLFIGNYDRMSVFTSRWTGMDIQTMKHDGFVTFELARAALPTIGANGTIYRRRCIKGIVGDFLMDIDLPYSIAAADQSALFAKVDVGIRHLYCSDARVFARKQTRRVRDYFHTRTTVERVYPWRSIAGGGIFRFVLSCISVVPLLWQTATGYSKSRNNAILFHPIACWITLWVYAFNVIFHRGRAFSRSTWNR